MIEELMSYWEAKNTVELPLFPQGMGGPDIYLLLTLPSNSTAQISFQFTIPFTEEVTVHLTFFLSSAAVR